MKKILLRNKTDLLQQSQNVLHRADEGQNEEELQANVLHRADEG